MPWLCRGVVSPPRNHFFQDLSWSNRHALACVFRSYEFLCVGLFALRTAYSHAPEAPVHFVQVDFVCRRLNREAFFGSGVGLPAVVGDVHRPVGASDASVSPF